MKTIHLYRPVGPLELAQIEAHGWRAFPARADHEPVFDPVLNRAYAARIAREWDMPHSGSGFVTRFAIEAAYISRFPVQILGAETDCEVWIPAEQLDEFNRHIVGEIEVIEHFELAECGPP